MLMGMILIVTPLYYYLRQQRMDCCKTDLGHTGERTFYLLACKCVGLKVRERQGLGYKSNQGGPSDVGAECGIMSVA